MEWDTPICVGPDGKGCYLPLNPHRASKSCACSHRRKVVSSDKIALIDLDGTVADYNRAILARLAPLRAPNEPAYDRDNEPPHVEARRKLIQQIPGFWRSLPEHPLGMRIVEHLKTVGFSLMVLTKGPGDAPGAWGEKLQWSQEHLPGAHVTVTQNKALVYGRVLVDDWPEYFEPWLTQRPNGLVVCVAQPWNTGYAYHNGARSHARVFRYDGSRESWARLTALLRRAFDRKSGESL